MLTNAARIEWQEHLFDCIVAYIYSTYTHMMANMREWVTRIMCCIVCQAVIYFVFISDLFVVVAILGRIFSIFFSEQNCISHTYICAFVFSSLERMVWCLNYFWLDCCVEFRTRMTVDLMRLIVCFVWNAGPNYGWLEKYMYFSVCYEWQSERCI